MDIILIPGFWLDGSSWDEVVPALEQAGHRTHALTLPGMESKDAPAHRRNKHHGPAKNTPLIRWPWVRLPGRSPLQRVYGQDVPEHDITTRSGWSRRTRS